MAVRILSKIIPKSSIVQSYCRGKTIYCYLTDTLPMQQASHTRVLCGLINDSLNDGIDFVLVMNYCLSAIDLNYYGWNDVDVALTES